MNSYTKFLMLPVFMAVCIPCFAGAVYDPVDPADPYGAVISGMFHNQPVNAGGVTGQYSIYIPQSVQPWSPAAIILIPGQTKAEAFAAGETGRRWTRLADAAGIAVAFLEAQNGGQWNDGRNESEFVRRVYLTMRSKDAKVEAAFAMDKYNVGLVGYGAGGRTAHLVASELPTVFSGMVAIDGDEVDAGTLEANGKRLCYPWPADNWLGMDDAVLPAGRVALPVWLIRTADSVPENNGALEYWSKVNGARKSGANAVADTYVCADPVCRVWVSSPKQAGEIDEAVIWNQFLGQTKRLLGFPGGRLAKRIDYTNDGASGFFISEELLDGFMRRWMTYVPTSLKPGVKPPLVLAMHGSSASMYAIADESLWHEAAEDNGFVVVYCQAFINSRSSSGVIPAAYWNEYATPVDAGGPDDVAYLKHIIAATVDRYGIDPGRVYVTGHSNGANMSWRMGLEHPELFAAIAPVGHTKGSRRDGLDTNLLLPVWTFKGEYDTDGAAFLTPDSTNAQALRFWNRRNRVDETLRHTSCDATGRFIHYTFPNRCGVPLVRFTSIDNSPHIYLPEQPRMIWNEFFRFFRRAEDGTLLFNGEPVQPESYRENREPIRGK